MEIRTAPNLDEVIGHYGFVLKENGTVKKCPKCNHRLNVYFSDEETEYNYECPKYDSGCGWVSGISRNYESEYAKQLGLYKKGEKL